jgi:hypothetical protein
MNFFAYHDLTPCRYLFDYKGKAPPTDYINKYRIDIDKVSDEIEGTSTSDPNKNAFGWHIISGKIQWKHSQIHSKTRTDTSQGHRTK